jgi:hypothetical protein
MSKYQVRFDSDKNHTYMVMELLTDDGGGNRFWHIIDEYTTEYEAQLVCRLLNRGDIHVEDLGIHAEFG